MATIDIVGIGDAIVTLPEKHDEFESLDNYYIIAKKIISSAANGIRTGLAEEMLKNDDAIANVAYAIMMADWRFDGRGNRHGYRKKMATYAIKNYVGRSAKSSKRRTYSLDNQLLNDDSDSFAQTMPDNHPTPSEIVESKDQGEKLSEKISMLLECGAISDQQATYLRQHFLYDISMADIGAMRGVSRQSVHDLITRALKELRQIAENDHFLRGIIENER
jgi:RNA polymerase sigma factor (sigma-70 family)